MCMGEKDEEVSADIGQTGASYGPIARYGLQVEGVHPSLSDGSGQSELGSLLDSGSYSGYKT